MRALLRKILVDVASTMRLRERAPAKYSAGLEM